MELFTLVLSIAFLQTWGAHNPLHHDRWFYRLVGFFSQNTLLVKWGGLVIVVTALPALALWLLQYLISEISIWLMLPISLIVLLFSFGRGDTKDLVREYTKACYVRNWDIAVQRAELLGVEVEGVAENDWNTLHHHVLDQAGYRGFERIFAVFFWFFLLGPAGALCYRLLAIYRHELHPEDALALRLLWLMEWPAVRLVGLSFAFTGNFVGCYNRWRECVICGRRSTVGALSPLILGALSVDDDTEQTRAVTRKELVLLHKLYARTLWFWLVCAALIILLF